MQILGNTNQNLLQYFVQNYLMDPKNILKIPIDKSLNIISSRFNSNNRYTSYSIKDFIFILKFINYFWDFHSYPSKNYFCWKSIQSWTWWFLWCLPHFAEKVSSVFTKSLVLSLTNLGIPLVIENNSLHFLHVRVPSIISDLIFFLLHR